MIIKLPLKEDHLSNEGSAYCASYTEMTIKLPLKEDHLSNEGSAYCPNYIIEICTTTSEIRTPQI